MPWREEALFIVKEEHGLLGLKLSGLELKGVHDGSPAALAGAERCIGMTLKSINGVRVMSVDEVVSLAKGPTAEVVFEGRYDADEVTIPRENASEEVGCVFDNTVLTRVLPSSRAEQLGVGAFAGRVVTHVNGWPVATLDDICDIAAATPGGLTLRFGPSVPSQPVHIPTSPLPTRQDSPYDPTPSYHPPSLDPHYHHQATPPELHPYHPHTPSPPQSPLTQQPSSPHPAPTTYPATFELVVDKERGQELGIRSTEGVVEQVRPGSPAAYFGAEDFVGMRITRVNGAPVVTTEAIGAYASPKRRVRLQFTSPEVLPSEVTVHRRTDEGLGCHLQEMFLVDVAPDSAAHRAGVSKFIGRRLTHTNGVPVSTPDDVKKNSGEFVVLRFAKHSRQDLPPVGSEVVAQGLVDNTVVNGRMGVVAGYQLHQSEEGVLVDFQPPLGRYLLRPHNLATAVRASSPFTAPISLENEGGGDVFLSSTIPVFSS
eukprot:Sspe_Gene.7642::Locus_2589_Transcript_2_2_Confidence_0.667_Length_1521::g.7642::m.7642